MDAKGPVVHQGRLGVSAGDAKGYLAHLNKTQRVYSGTAHSRFIIRLFPSNYSHFCVLYCLVLPHPPQKMVPLQKYLFKICVFVLSLLFKRSRRRIIRSSRSKAWRQPTNIKVFFVFHAVGDTPSPPANSLITEQPL